MKVMYPFIFNCLTGYAAMSVDAKGSLDGFTEFPDTFRYLFFPFLFLFQFIYAIGTILVNFNT